MGAAAVRTGLFVLAAYQVSSLDAPRVCLFLYDRLRRKPSPKRTKEAQKCAFAPRGVSVRVLLGGWRQQVDARSRLGLRRRFALFGRAGGALPAPSWPPSSGPGASPCCPRTPTRSPGERVFRGAPERAHHTCHVRVCERRGARGARPRAHSPGSFILPR